MNWRNTVNKDLQKIGFTWEEAEVAALDRHGWRQSVAQCVCLMRDEPRSTIRTDVIEFITS